MAFCHSSYVLELGSNGTPSGTASTPGCDRNRAKNRSCIFGRAPGEGTARAAPATSLSGPRRIRLSNISIASRAFCLATVICSWLTALLYWLTKAKFCSRYLPYMASAWSIDRLIFSAKFLVLPSGRFLIKRS